MRALLVGLALVVAAATACSSSTTAGNGSGSTVASSPAPTASGGFPSSSPSPSQVPSTPTSSDDTATLGTKLLTAGEVGPGFTGQASDAAGGPPPCGSATDPSLDSQVPPTAKVAENYVHASPEAQLVEELIAYSDEATAQRAVTIGKAGLNCTAGNLYSADGTATPITIGAPQSTNLNIPQVNEAIAWTLKNAAITGAFVAIRYSGNHLLVLTFLAPVNADTSKLPDTGKIVTAAVTKALS
jgi:hypothetical protein